MTPVTAYEMRDYEGGSQDEAHTGKDEVKALMPVVLGAWTGNHLMDSPPGKDVSCEADEPG